MQSSTLKDVTQNKPKLLSRYTSTRQRTASICRPLSKEDYVVQPVEDVSPPKWHLGHTTWFFEQFVLIEHVADYQPFDEQYSFVFNSYYENAGKRVVRAHRGNLSRPTVEKVYEYRKHVDEAMEVFLSVDQPQAIWDLIEIGCNHEEQHQELLITDIKYILGNNPLLPKYGPFDQSTAIDTDMRFIPVDAGIYSIGYAGEGFHFDNEKAVHKVYLQAYEIADRLVTNGEYMEFMEAGGYQDFNLWHSEGWEFVKQLNIKAPLYWYNIDGTWHQYTLAGLQPVQRNEILKHVSYYEAFAFAQWKGMRLPTEFEWEAAQAQFEWGQRWEWTESAYLPYPNYSKVPGALGEYNGKFMVNQKVLRGASVATSPNHSRPTYRNFFHPPLRWQFTGIRLAQWT
ncbi:MAG: ergothioneine biosynthesis protein EgtB [Saprospiraceae bacterium]|nr:ergothioneine biosynthesis protein EgtB [Saprospiraceae bacterium]